MLTSRITIISLMSLLSCFGLAQLLSAQNWTDPTSPPPNSTIPNISALAGDNLGILNAVGSHQAKYDLNMNGWPIDRIGTGGGVNPGISVSATGSGIGLYATSSKTGLYAESSATPISGWASVGAFNHGNGYGLITQSDRGGIVSAKLYGTTVLQEINAGSQGRLQLGSTPENSFSVAPATDDGGKLYYGSSLLCDPTKVDCGFATSGTYGPDNLGLNDPHIATKNLDLNGNRIINVVANLRATTPTASTNNLTSQAPGVLVTNNGGSHLGQPTALYGATSVNDNSLAGIYGYHNISGAGILAASASGIAAEIHGSFNTLMNSSAGAGDQYISFGPLAGTNKLRAASSSTGLVAAGSKLYWGNMQLCDQTSGTCGWQTASPMADQWRLSGQTLYYRASNVSNPARTNVGIGVDLTIPPPFTPQVSHQLEVHGLTRSTGGYLGNLVVTNATVNNQLQVGNDLWVGGDVTLNGVTGVLVDGEISVSANGITIGGTQLTKTDLQNLITACGASCL